MLMLAAASLLVNAVMIVLLVLVVRDKRHRDPCLHNLIGLRSPWKYRGREQGRWYWDNEGVPWHDAPIPTHPHVCAVQTCEISVDLMHIDRCACGAVRFGAGPWYGVGDRVRLFGPTKADRALSGIEPSAWGYGAAEARPVLGFLDHQRVRRVRQR